MKRVFVCDFETANNSELNKEETWVWLAVAYELNEDKVYHVSNNINTFIDDFLFKYPNSTIYFHNVAFDGNFLLNELVRRGFKPERDRKEYHTFKAVIDNMNNYYKIKITLGWNKHLKQWNSITIYDSFKIIPLSEHDMAKSFKLDTLKGSIDYTKPRPKGYIPTEDEIKYCIDDTKIAGKGLKYFMELGILNGMTIGSIAMKEYKQTCPKFDFTFPIVSKEVDDFIRSAYRGGITYANPKTRCKDIGEGMVFDANSLYPSQMKLKPMPYGNPVYFEGHPDNRPFKDIYNLYIVHIIVELEVKKNHIPTIQIKHSLSFNPTEFIKSTTEPTDMWVSNIDLELMYQQYDIYHIEYIDGYMFKSKIGMFDEYINKWAKVKEENTGAIRQIAKLLLNNLYGKFATNPLRITKVPYLDEDGVLRTTQSTINEINPVYTAVGVFITAYGRQELITYAQANYDRFLYCDTDSIHITGTETPNLVPIHETHFGYWKKELDFIGAKYLRAKTYMEYYLDENGDIRYLVKCAGLPSAIRDTIKPDDFYLGAEFKGKLARKSVKGGVILEETTFKIKED